MDTESFTCDRCHREVPIGNMELHLVRCRDRKTSPAAATNSDFSSPATSNIEYDYGAHRSSSSVSSASDFLLRDDESDVEFVDEGMDVYREPIPSVRMSLVDDSPGIKQLWRCYTCRQLNDYDINECCHCRAPRDLKWSCQACTFENSIAAAECEVCGTRRRIAPDFRAESTTTSSPHIEGWMCGGCTYLNDNGRSRCAMCNSLNQFSATSTTARTATGNPFGSSITDSSALQGALFGGLLGAGAAYLDDNDMIGGAVQGATVGFLGGLLMNHTIGSSRTNADQAYSRTAAIAPLGSMYGEGMAAPGSDLYIAQRRSRQTTATSGRAYRVRPNETAGYPPFELEFFNNFIQSVTGPDIDSMDYEELYDRFGGNQPRPATLETISSLPVEVLGGSSALSFVPDSGSCAECAICMEQMESGERVQTLPCLHRFHQDCSEKWLRQSGKCPVCKHDLSSL